MRTQSTRLSSGSWGPHQQWFSVVSGNKSPQKTPQCIFSIIPAMGAAYGTAKSGTGIAAMAVMRPEAIMKSIIPVVMAGML